jgi:hypothetical protein
MKGAAMLKWIVGHHAGGETLPQGTDLDKAYEGIRAYLRLENAHIQNRIQWNLTLQGFLFASFALALGKDANPRVAVPFVRVVVMVGILSCLVTLLGLYAAYHSMNRSKKLWLANEAALAPKGARPFSDPWPSLLGRLPATLTMLVLLFAWVELSRIPLL